MALQVEGGEVLTRNNVVVTGAATGRPLVLAHGFGCDQDMWRLLVPHFVQDHPVVLFDHVGAGGSDLSAYDPVKYDRLDGYADDLVEILDALDLDGAVVVAHSVSAMIAVLASARAGSRVGALVLVGPSPRYVDDESEGYRGGFSREDIEGLLQSMEENHLGWSATMAPVIMGADHVEESAELERSFCRTDPTVAAHFAEVTFLSDNRRDLGVVAVPTLVLQCSQDVIAPAQVGRYVHEHIAGSRLVELAATGHCPHLSAPEETAAAIAGFLAEL